MSPTDAASAGEDSEKFRIVSRRRILEVLDGLIDTHSPVTVYYDGGAGYLVTNLLAVNPEFEEMIFEPDADPAANRALLAAAPLDFVSFLDNVRVELRAGRAERTVFRGADVLRARIPDALLWFQRRAQDRIATPVVDPLMCLLPGAEEREAMVLDLSGGGLSLMIPAAELSLAPHSVIEGCRLDLPGQGSIAFGLRVHSVLDVPHAVPPMRRYGCEFLALDPAMGARLRGYMEALRARRETRP